MLLHGICTRYFFTASIPTKDPGVIIISRVSLNLTMFVHHQKFNAFQPYNKKKIQQLNHAVYNYILNVYHIYSDGICEVISESNQMTY